MKELRILFTGVGRRIELIQAFRQAALHLGINLKLYGADMAGTAPALTYCDFTRKVCGMGEPEYIRQLLEICKEDHIDLLIPTIDTDLLILSKNVQEFEKEGTKVLVSKPEKIAVCRDKNYTADFFESCGLKAPRTYNNYKKYLGEYPCFIKPKDGSSSINAFKVNDLGELEVYAEKIGDYIVQPYIEGKEYTIDVFCDFDGSPIYITPRERVAVRAGEVLKTKICMDDRMIQESRKLIEKFRPCGPMAVQLIRQDVTGEDYFIEINPRFGGGSPLSMKSGARSAEAILKMLSGERIEYEEPQWNGAVYSRFDQSVCIDTGKGLNSAKGVIFDLDDTLYSEKQYVKSGYKKIAEYIGHQEAEEKLWNYFLEGKPAIDAYLKEIGAENKKAECLDIYRSQMPEINLYDGVAELFQGLKENDIKVGIITDGRPEGQRNKIKALGLEELVDDIIITDELGGIQFRKPNDISFRIMQCRWRIPFEQIVYIGDNLAKDFQAPRQLGMQGIYIKNEDGLYSNQGNAYGILNIVTSLDKVKDALLS
ncbi:HAD-IA family hydrolase [Lachnospiraceae bacterium JLR.KK009]|nr:HAD hydrolase, family IA [Lachnospiraceae bacterium A2]